MASMSEIEGIEIPTSSGTNQNLGKSMAYRTPGANKNRPRGNGTWVPNS